MKDHSLVENLPFDVFLMSEVFEDCNKRTCLLLGRRYEDVVGHSRVDFSTPTQSDNQFSAVEAKKHIDAAFRAVLENLLGNAWKYTGQTADAVIEFGAEEQEGETVYFVRENGSGFDMAYADKLFPTFHRLHKTDEFTGIGIGLATVQRIIHRHGGRIWAQAAVGQGATVYFTLGGIENDHE